MKRILLFVVLFVGISYAQEQDGLFLGFEVGTGELQIKQSDTYSKITNGIYGAKFGYKYFFNEVAGIRGYANLNYAETRFSDSTSKGALGALLYGVNVDALINFFNTESGSMGMFLGVGLGAQTYLRYDIYGPYADAKIGLRGSYGNHGIDFTLKFPFIEATRNYNSIDTKVKHTYQAMLGYSYTF